MLKCILPKQEHPTMLERLLTRRTVWAPPMSTKAKQSRLEVPQHFKEQHFSCIIMPVHIFSLRQP